MAAARRGSRGGSRDAIYTAAPGLSMRAQDGTGRHVQAAVGLGSSSGRARGGGRHQQVVRTWRREREGEEREMADWAGRSKNGPAKWAVQGEKKKRGRAEGIGLGQKENGLAEEKEKEKERGMELGWAESNEGKKEKKKSPKNL